MPKYYRIVVLASSSSHYGAKTPYGVTTNGLEPATEFIVLRKLASRLAAVSAKLGREINPHVMTLDEYLNRCRSGEHYVASVIKTERHMLVGDADELGRMEKQRLA